VNLSINQLLARKPVGLRFGTRDAAARHSTSRRSRTPAPPGAGLSVTELMRLAQQGWPGCAGAAGSLLLARLGSAL